MKTLQIQSVNYAQHEWFQIMFNVFKFVYIFENMFLSLPLKRYNFCQKNFQKF